MPDTQDHSAASAATCECGHSWDRHGPEAGGYIECRCRALSAAPVADQDHSAASAAPRLRQVGWLGPYGLIPGGMDNDPAPHWRAVYVVEDERRCCRNDASGMCRKHRMEAMGDA